MSLCVSANSGSGERRDPIPEGSYAAVCVGMVDIGEQITKFEGKEMKKHQIVIVWELPEETIEVDGQMVSRTISKTYTASLHERSALRKDLKSWRGREFTEDELEGFNLRNILSAPCLLQIIHRVTPDGSYANISSIMSLPKGMPKPTPTITPYAFEIETSSLEDFEALPKWLKRKVEDSQTWRDRCGDYKDPANQTEANRSAWKDLEDADDGDLPF